MNIKLIIWDLDETFWQGTLSEEGIVPKQDFIDLVKILTSHGIINSISSKNNYEDAKRCLEKLNVWEYFVFPKIGWYSKGEAIRDTINEMGLRPVNVLFIDDNHMNLQEAVGLIPDINVMHPEQFDCTFYNALMKGERDLSNKRLNQYKILEKKSVIKKEYSTDTEFLVSCDIHVDIRNATLSNLDRIHELISRANQLNYTKLRDNKEDLKIIIENNQCREVYVSDKYGDYGLVGFVAFDITGEKLLHFCFSCRTINLGIEQYVYSKFDYPELNVVQPVAVELSIDASPHWIKNGIYKGIRDDKENVVYGNVFFKGGCDLTQMLSYIKSNESIVSETNSVSDYGLPYHAEHTTILLGQVKPDDFFHYLPKSSFSSNIFSPDNTVIILSLLMDYTQDLYINSETGEILPFGGYNQKTTPINSNVNSIQSLDYLYENFKNIGQLSQEKFRFNLEQILSKVAENATLILINGCEIEDPTNEYLLERHQSMNLVVDDFVKENNNRVKLLDVRKYVKSKADITDNARHYKSYVYKCLADELIFIMKDGTSLSGVNFIDDKLQTLKININTLKKRIKSVIKR